MNMDIWLLVHQINPLGGSKTAKNFPKNRLVTDKTPLFDFVVAILFVLIMVSDRPVVNGNDVFSVSVVSTKKRYSSFSKKGFRFPENLFQKICFKVLKSFETFTDCHIKTCRSFKRRAKYRFLEEAMLFLLALK